MKKNIYTCEICKNEVNTANRDEGTTPMMIGCVVEGCIGLGRSHFYHVDQSIVPEMIFIRPKNKDEWKIVKEQLKEEIRMENPKKKERKVEKTMNNLMFRIVDHVNKGGLVQLPVHIVQALKEYNNG